MPTTIYSCPLLFVALLTFAGCTHHSTALPPLSDSIGPAPAIASSDPITTAAAYTDAFESAQQALPKSLTEAHGTPRLIAAVRALAACKSEPARLYARGFIKLFKSYGLNTGPVPSPGTPAITYAELATVDALSQSIMRGPQSDKQGPPPAGTGTIPYSLHLQILELISRVAPSEAAATSAAFNTTNSLPVDVALDDRLSPHQTRQLYFHAWDNFRARFTDPARPVNLTSAVLGRSSSTFVYALDYAGNCLAESPERALTGHELQDFVSHGFYGINSALKTLDPSMQTDDNSFDLLSMARTIDDNVTLTRVARADITVFFAALAGNNDAAVKSLSAKPERQTAAQWRDYFGFDRPAPLKSLEILALGITDTSNQIAVSIKKTDAAGKVESEVEYITLRKQDSHWVIIEG